MKDYIKEDLQPIYDIDSKADALRNEMKRSIQTLRDNYPVKDEEVEEFLSIIEKDAVERLDGTCLTMFYSDGYHLLNVGELIPGDVLDHYQHDMFKVGYDGVTRAIKILKNSKNVATDIQHIIL